MKITAVLLPFSLLLSATGCGGGGSSNAPIPEGVDRLLYETGPFIEDSVQAKAKYGTGAERVRYWFDDELRIEILDANRPDTAVLSLSSARDRVRTRILPALSGPYLHSRQRQEFDLRQSTATTDTIATIGVDYAGSTDYFVYGYWLSVDHELQGVDQVDTGAFSSALRFPTEVPQLGTATYVGLGQASGLHTVTYSGVDPPGDVGGFSGKRGEFRIAHFVGDVDLTADFGSGSIKGKITKLRYPENERSATGPIDGGNETTRPFRIEFKEAPIDATGGFSGSVATHTPATWPEERRIDPRNTSGRWDGQFSSRPTHASDATPRAVAGTFATTFTFNEGTVGTYLGTWSAANCPSCVLPDQSVPEERR